MARVLFSYDFQHNTAEAMPELLHELKTRGYRVVHLVPKGTLATLPNYDAMVSQADKLSSNNTRPELSVVQTIAQ